MTLKNKTILRYALVLGFGILVGWLVFATGNKATHQHELHAVQNSGEVTYTCAMHPQVRQTEPGQCPICGMDLTPLQADAEAENPYQLTMSKEAVKLANIQTKTVGTANKTPTREGSFVLSGKLEMNESNVLSQSAHFPGRLEKLFVNYEGQEVQVGQTIALLYSPELLTAQQELLEALKYEESNPSLVVAAKQKLRLLKLSDEQITKIISAGTPITNWPLQADYSGVVTRVHVDMGAHISEGATLYEVAQLNTLWAVFDAYEANLSTIRIGDPLLFTVPAYPGQEFKAEVAFIDPFVDPKTRTIEVRAEVENIKRLLKPKMFARAELSAGSNEPTPKGGRGLLLVPKSAVMYTGRRSVVYVKVPGKKIPTYQAREVTLGSPLEDYYQIEAGLEPGEEVVIHGTFAVDAAAQLNNKPSMMNRDIQIRQSNNNAEQTQFNVPELVMATPAAFQQQLKPLLDRYLLLKDKLVVSESKEAQQLAEQLSIQLGQVDITLLTTEAQQYWTELSGRLNKYAKAMASEDNIDTQRKYFMGLSDETIHIARSFGVTAQLYVQYCPMADDDQGANWLSDNSEVRNPYYGNMMLSCGEVKEVIKP